MYRFALDYLINWKNRKRRKPLVLRGSRQVGKSYLVAGFAKSHYNDFIEINFEKDPDIAPLFIDHAPSETLKLLELKLNRKIDISGTVLFLDEIQAAPAIFAKLRYFYEDIPELHVIAAGSLLELVLEEHTFSMPVGRIEYLYLGPMTFEEFLIARDRKLLYEYLLSYEPGKKIPASIHNELMSEVKLYTILGGMPEVIAAYLESGSFMDSEIIKASVLNTYEDDFSKYGEKINIRRVVSVYKKLPQLVGQRVKYVNIDRNERAKDLADALHLLELAGLTRKVKHSACNGLPLTAQENDKIFKLIFLDVGLMISACGINMLDIQKTEDLIFINSGEIAEQFVGQHLLFSEAYFKKPELHYWVREAKSSNAEVDYVIAAGSDVVPVQVKAGKTGRLKSLHQFILEKKPAISIRINSDPPSLMATSNAVADKTKIDYQLLSIPFYLVGRISSLIARL